MTTPGTQAGTQTGKAEGDHLGPSGAQSGAGRNLGCCFNLIGKAKRVSESFIYTFHIVPHLFQREALNSFW